MNNDRELLELAAKAAGMPCHRYCEAWKAMAAYTMQDGYYGPSWNPLTDDGDALRLAVKLELSELWFDKSTGRPEVVCGKPGFAKIACEPANDDPCAATRRAIVRVAADIGKAMP